MKDESSPVKHQNPVHVDAIRCPVDVVPAPGDVGLDLRAVCPVCQRRIRITVRGRFAPHNRKVGKDAQP